MHDLHKEVAKEIEGIIKSNNQLALHCDPACVSTQNLPFFLDGEDGKLTNKTEITNVDLMIVKNNEVVLVCEIEESDISPIRIFGKLYAFVHSTKCKLKNKVINISDNCAFLQVVSTKKLKPISSKMKQWENIEKSINQMACKCYNRTVHYKLLYGSVNEFKKGTHNHTGITTLISKL